MDKCTAHSKRTHLRCGRYPSPGKAVCYYHGGAKGSGRPAVTGRYSQFFAPDDEEGRATYEAFRDDLHLEELANEVAKLRAKFAQYEKVNSKKLDPRTIDVFLSFLEGIGRLVEKRHKIKYGEQVTITERHFDYLASRVLDIAKGIFGNDERYARFLTECRNIQVEASDRTTRTA